MSPDTGLKSTGDGSRSDVIQKDIIEKWMNRVLESKTSKVSDLYEDIKDGFALYALCEVRRMRSFSKLCSLIDFFQGSGWS
jgi:hypothetical protein